MAPQPIEIAVEPPAELQLDYDPSVAEVLATLQRAFGWVEVEQWPAGHESPSPAYQTPRGRRLPLDGDVSDFRAAVDQLDRDTCSNNGDHCQGRRRCRRHSPRSRRPA